MSTFETINIDQSNNDIVNDRYKVRSICLSDPLIQSDNFRNKKKEKLPLILYVFFFSLLLLLAFVILVIVLVITKKENYEVHYEPYLKPLISNHNYTQVNFSNGLELLITQVDENDTSGGSISFDTGYLDTKYKPGYLNLAFLSLISNDTSRKKDLEDYLGNFEYSVDEFYSTFSFSILNAGFFKFLKKFSNLTFLEENDERLKDTHIQSKISILENSFKSDEKNLKKRENHLLQYLIYGYKNKEKEILPQGNIEINNTIDYNEIRNIMKELVNNPSKIKIVLTSHFKVSLVKKSFLNFFKIIINKERKEERSQKAYNISDFIKQKMIYYNISEYEKNFIKINYFIDDKYNNYSKLFIDSGYFNYLKYILDETYEESLYYMLREVYNITSLSCDYEVILKSKIKFSITLYLNDYSYDSISIIINKVYEYIHNITKYINSLNDEDLKASELFKIVSQNFTYTEDYHDSFTINKKRAIQLFFKNEKNYFLRDVWLPGNFFKNLNYLKDYTNQLTPKNSVIIFGFNDYTLDKIKNTLESQNIYYLFDENDIQNTKYFSLKYSCFDLDIDFEKKFNYDDPYQINNHANIYISNYTSESDLVYDPLDEEKYYTETSKSINKDDNGLKEFFFKKDTSFHLPKVYIILYFFHPYLRAKKTEKDTDKYFEDNKFFQIILHLTYLEREINFKLADAIRAGNIIEFDFNQNLFYIDVFAFSDVAEMILKVITEIIESYSEQVIKSKFEIYRETALKDYLNFYSVDILKKLRLYFYQYLTKTDNKPHIYNYYSFPSDEFRSRNVEEILYDYINSFIIQGFIYGYYEEKQANNLYSNFYISKEDNFNQALSNANLNNVDLNSSNFIGWIKEKYNLTKDIEYKDEDKCGKYTDYNYRFMRFSEYKIENRIMSEVFERIFNNNENNNNNNYYIKTKIFCQNQIYAQFTLSKNLNKKDFIENITDIINNNKGKYKENVDVIGDRFYYILSSLIQKFKSRREDMKSSAISSLDSNFYYKGENFDKLNDIKQMEYDEFLEKIEDYFENIKYVNFNCQK